MNVTRLTEHTGSKFQDSYPTILAKATQLPHDTLASAFEWLRDELLAGTPSSIIGRTFAVNDFGDDNLIVVGRHGVVVYTSEWVVVRIGGYADSDDVLTPEHWGVLETSLARGHQPRTIIDVMDILVSGNELKTSTIPPKDDVVLNGNQSPWYLDKNAVLASVKESRKPGEFRRHVFGDRLSFSTRPLIRASDNPTQMPLFKATDIVMESGRFYYELTNSDGQCVRHETSGSVFYKDEQDGVLFYRDLLRSEELTAKLIQGIQGTETGVFYNAMVRRGKCGDYHYYPLPLIYASTEERHIAAKEIGRRPPPERWVARRRRFVNEVLNQTT